MTDGDVALLAANGFPDYLDLIETMIVALDTEGRLTAVNRKGCELLGWSEEELVGRSWFAACLPEPEGHDELLPMFREMIAGEREPSRYFEGPVRTRDGAIRTIAWHNTHLRDEGGKIVGMVIAGNDITDRKRAEKELRESEARFRALIENASDGITILDPEGRNRYLSPAAERITGYTAEELEGRSAFEFVHPDDVEKAEAMWAQILEEPDAVVVEELRFRLKDGSWRTLECTGSNLTNAPGVRGIVINTRDVTERKELEAQLRHAQRMEAVGRLAGGIAHDFNNLLTVIRGQTDLILNDLDDSEELAEDVEVIRRAAERAARLTGQLLAVGSEQVLRPRIVDLNRVVRGMEELFRRVLGEDVRLDIDLQDDLPSVEIDAGQLEQVIMNLAVNARAAMPGGGCLRLSTELVESSPTAGERTETGAGPFVSLKVSDTGRGMDPETRKRIFEPFFSTHRDEGGTGLGLSVSYGIVKQSGGTIHVRSAPGLGTTFDLRFPAIQRETQEPRADRGSEPPASPSDPVSGTILLVDDDLSVRRVSRRILERAGMRVRVAADVESALDILATEAGNVDLVITDLVLPDAGGAELAARVRDRFPGTRLLAMSGRSSGRARAELPRDVELLEKPFSLEKLTRAVRRALGREP